MFDCVIIFQIMEKFWKVELNLDIQIGDVLEMKKSHPCGEKLFTVLRSGIDFRLRCNNCGREFLIPRVKAEKNIKKVIREENNDW